MASRKFQQFLQLGKQQLEQNNPALAIDSLKEALKQEPDNAKACHFMAHAYYMYFTQTRKKQYLKLAREHIDNSLRLAPEFAHSHYIKALILGCSRYRINRIRAKKCIRQAIALVPENAAYHVAAGALFTRRYFLPKDRSDYYRRALELNPGNAKTLAAFAAYRFFYRADMAGAEQYARAALAIDPANEGALILMGHIFYRKKRYQEAKEHAVFVLTQNPKNYSALTLICMLEGRRNLFIGSSYRLGLMLKKPGTCLAFLAFCLVLQFTLGIGLLVLLYANFASLSLKHRVKKNYLTDVKLQKGF